MGEKKTTVVGASTGKETQVGQGKMSYEQLENVAHQLSEQSRKLYQQLQDVQLGNTFKRLDYLFKTLEYAQYFEPTYVRDCSDEIVTIMEIKEEPTEGNTEN